MMDDEYSRQNRLNDDLVALADSVTDSLAALLSSGDATSRTMRGLQTTEQSVVGNTSPISCGVFRKMRYIPKESLDDETQIDRFQKNSPEPIRDRSVSPYLGPRSEAIKFDEPASLSSQALNYDYQVSKKMDFAALDSRKSIDSARSDLKKSNRFRSSSPNGRPRLLNDGLSSQDPPKKQGNNNSPRRSLSPRRNIIGPTGAYTSKNMKSVDVSRPDEGFNPREPAGAFRRKKPLAVKAANSFSKDSEYTSELENPTSSLHDGRPYSATLSMDSLGPASQSLRLRLQFPSSLLHQTYP